jgi:hypothetical protein
MTWYSFLGDFRAEHPDLKGQELGKQGGAAWHQLPQARREVCGTCIDSLGNMTQLE